MEARGYIILSFSLKKEGTQWTALCKELGTATCANTFEEAHKRIIEAVELHLNTLEEVGERERFFQQNKIRIYPHRPRKKEISIGCATDPGTFIGPYVYLIHKELLGR